MGPRTISIRTIVTPRAELRRLRLKSSLSEASALLAIDDAALLKTLSLDEGYWLAHDEGGLGSGAARSMVSIVGRVDDDWTVTPVKLTDSAGKGPRPITDAEALAAHGDWVFVVGSGFLGANNKLDRRRAFITRFSPAELRIKPKGLTGHAEVLNLGTDLLTAVNDALATSSTELMATSAPVSKATTKASGGSPESTPINIEGAACIGSCLFLGLRWPVTTAGGPLIVEVDRGAELIAGPWTDATAGELAALPMSVHDVDAAGASKKKALGIRALSTFDGNLHAITGPTDRDIAATKMKAGGYTHVRIDPASDGVVPLETFEGYRKVEALAARPDGGWIYGLDDEKAIILLISES